MYFAPSLFPLITHVPSVKLSWCQISRGVKMPQNRLYQYWKYLQRQKSPHNQYIWKESMMVSEYIRYICMQVFLSAFLADVCGYYTPFIQVLFFEYKIEEKKLRGQFCVLCWGCHVIFPRGHVLCIMLCRFQNIIYPIREMVDNWYPHSVDSCVVGFCFDGKGNDSQT